MYVPFKDRTGERFGRLVVIGYVGKNNQNYRMWRCLCDCGNEKIAAWRELSRGHTQSCGCLFRETLSKTHGMNKLPLGEAAFNALFYTYKKSARERKHEWRLDRDTFKKLTSADCYYCGESANAIWYGNAQRNCNGFYLYNGIDRVDNTQGYIKGNVVTCCKRCNVAKADMSQQEFFEWINRVAAYIARLECDTLST